MKKILLLTSLLLTNIVNAEEIITEKSLIRTEDQTYLTIPEWYLVHSPEEYSDYLNASKSPAHFPFTKHIGQFWDTYYQSYSITKDKYPFNMEYNIMVSTIGVSTTMEYTMKGLYEAFIGSITEQLGSETQEDKYSAQVAKDYVDFIKIDPWYKFDFMKSFKDLWTTTDLLGSNIVRKFERKYALSTEYLVKASYAYLIKKATTASFDKPIPYSSVLIKGIDKNKNPDIIKISNINGNDLLRLPRYGEFTNTIQKLAMENNDFIEICGNRTKINVAILPPINFDTTTYPSKVFINQPIYTKPDIKRIVYEVDITQLAAMLRDLKQKNIKIEHIYDY